jgi:hypothetical protein
MTMKTIQTQLRQQKELVKMLKKYIKIKEKCHKLEVEILKRDIDKINQSLQFDFPWSPI